MLPVFPGTVIKHPTLPRIGSSVLLILIHQIALSIHFAVELQRVFRTMNEGMSDIKAKVAVSTVNMNLY
jgi:hypothetical protein